MTAFSGRGQVAALRVAVSHQMQVLEDRRVAAHHAFFRLQHRRGAAAAAAAAAAEDGGSGGGDATGGKGAGGYVPAGDDLRFRAFLHAQLRALDQIAVVAGTLVSDPAQDRDFYLAWLTARSRANRAALLARLHHRGGDRGAALA